MSADEAKASQLADSIGYVLKYSGNQLSSSVQVQLAVSQLQRARLHYTISDTTSHYETLCRLRTVAQVRMIMIMYILSMVLCIN